MHYKIPAVLLADPLFLVCIYMQTFLDKLYGQSNWDGVHSFKSFWLNLSAAPNSHEATPPLFRAKHWNCYRSKRLATYSCNWLHRYTPFSHPNWVWSSYWAVAGNSVCAATDTGSSCTDLSPLSIRRWSMLVCGFNLDRSIIKRRSTCTWLWHGLLLFDRFSASYHMNFQYT